MNTEARLPYGAIARLKLERGTDRPLTLVAVGKAGVGKSSTFNSIIEHENCTETPASEFDERTSIHSVTKRYDERWVMLNGLFLRLIDTVGFCNADSKDSSIIAQLDEVMRMCDEDAFLLMTSAVGRFTIDIADIVETFGV